MTSTVCPHNDCRNVGKVRSRRGVRIAVLAGAIVIIGATLAGCGSETSDDKNSEIAVEGALSANTVGLNARTGTCKFWDGTVSGGEQVVLRSADQTLVATGELTFDPAGSGTSKGEACSFDFDLGAIALDDSQAYEITFGTGDFEPVIVDREIVESGYIGLRPRDQFDALAGERTVVEVKGRQQPETSEAVN